MKAEKYEIFYLIQMAVNPLPGLLSLLSRVNSQTKFHSVEDNRPRL